MYRISFVLLMRQELELVNLMFLRLNKKTKTQISARFDDVNDKQDF